MQTPPPSLPPVVHHDEANSSAALRAVKDITFGSIAGMVSKVFEHPFDLTKVRLQSQVLDATARFNGPIDCLVQTWSKEGVRGLYRGLPAPIVGAMAENASMFVSYNQIQNAVRWYSGQSPADELTLGQLSVAAAGAGAITSFFLTPIELVKCKMQVQMLLTPPASLEVLAPPTNTGAATLSAPSGSKIHKLPGPIAVLKSVVQTSGLRGLWLGQTGTLIRETGGGAAWFVSKEAVARLLISRRPSSSSSASISTSSSNGGPSQKQHLAVWESAVSGGFAGLAYNVALFPADTVKSAVQTEAEMRPRAPGEPYPSFVATARAMYKAQGLRGLYAGCGITAARAVPSSALIFVIYDGLTKRFG